MTEPKVVRYKARNPASIREFPDGGYVRYSDYEALAARVKELEEGQMEDDKILAWIAASTADLDMERKREEWD